MKRRTNNILMIAYILFIFIAVFTRHLYAQTKWNYIVTAISVTSWVLVLSDTLAAAADVLNETVLTMRPKLESYLCCLRNNRSINSRLDAPAKDEYGDDIGKTIGQILDSIEKSTLNSLAILKKQDKTKKWLMKLSDFFMLFGFILFFCVLLFDPVFNFFHNKLDGMTVLAFGTIIATQFCSNVLKERTLKIRNVLDTLNEGMEVLNKSCKAEATTNAD